MIPSRATAKIDVRLVPDQRPVRSNASIRRHVARVAPGDGPRRPSGVSRPPRPVTVDRGDPAVRAAAEAYRRGFGASPVPLRMGGIDPRGRPARERTGPSTVLMGFGLPDDGIHSPNERFHLPNFFGGIATSIWFLSELSRAAGRILAQGRVMIIDCHCHAGKGDGLTGPWDTAAPLGRYLRRAREAGIERHRALRRLSLRLSRRQPRGRAHRRRPARPLLRFRVRQPARDRGPHRRDGSRGGRALRLPRDQGASPRRAHHAGGLRGGPRVRAARPLRRDGRGRGGRAARPRVSGRGLHHPAPRQLRRRLARAAARRSTSSRATPTSTPTRRACGGSTCSSRRSARRRPGQDPLRHRRAVAAPGRRAVQGATLLGLPPAGERAGARRESPAADRAASRRGRGAAAAVARAAAAGSRRRVGGQGSLGGASFRRPPRDSADASAPGRAAQLQGAMRSLRVGAARMLQISRSPPRRRSAPRSPRRRSGSPERDSPGQGLADAAARIRRSRHVFGRDRRAGPLVRRECRRP